MIQGLIVLRDAIFMNDLLEMECFIDGIDNNQYMAFGALPHQVQPLVDIGYLEIDRNPVFDQMIINKYKIGDYLCKHVDLLSFEDYILIANIKGSAEFTFEHVSNEIQHKITMHAGDVIILSNSARYDYKHGIENITEPRYSITLRKLKPT